MEVLIDEVHLKRTFKLGILKCKAQNSLFDKISLTQMLGHMESLKTHTLSYK